MIYNTLGYFPNNIPEEMSYLEWCDTFGKYRWYHKNGESRTQYKLDYNWKEIYDKAIKYCDLHFQDRNIIDVFNFTHLFLSEVPINWMKYKTSLEFFSGVLDGNTINPDIFEQGFTRTFNELYNDNENSNTDELIGERSVNETYKNDTDNNAKTNVGNYQQGVTQYNTMPTDFDTDYMSNYNLSTAENNQTEDSSTNTNQSSQDNKYLNKKDSNYNRNINEKVTRINYYDNLAFLRERMEKITLLNPFQSYFEHLFNNVYDIGKWW